MNGALNKRQTQYSKMADSHNEIGISHLLSKNEVLLDGRKTNEEGEQEDLVTKESSETNSFGETGKVTERTLIMSEMLTVDNKNVTTKQNQKRKACKIESLDKPIIKHFEDAEISTENVPKKRIINTSLAGETSANEYLNITLLKQENELLDKKLKDFESRHKIEFLNSQVMLKTILRLRTKNVKLQNKNKKLEQDVNDNLKSNKDMCVITDVMEEYDKIFDNEFIHPIGVTSKEIKFSQKVKDLENCNTFMISENKSMMKEIGEFFNTNKHLNEIKYALEKHKENINKELDSVKEENRILNQKLHEFNDKNIHMNKRILNLTNQNIIFDCKLKVTEEDNAAKAQRIEVLYSEIENFNKAYLNILQTSQFDDTLQPYKENVAIETPLGNYVNHKSDELSSNASDEIAKITK